MVRRIKRHWEMQQIQQEKVQTRSMRQKKVSTSTAESLQQGPKPIAELDKQSKQRHEPVLHPKNTLEQRKKSLKHSKKPGKKVGLHKIQPISIPAEKESEIINQNSISYEISIKYRTPERSNRQIVQERVQRIRNKRDGQSPEIKLKQFGVIEQKETNETMKRSERLQNVLDLNCQNEFDMGFMSKWNEKSLEFDMLLQNSNNNVNKPSQVKSILSSKPSIKSLFSIIKNTPQQCNKKQQKQNKIQQKFNQIQEKGDIEQIAKQIYMLNNGHKKSEVDGNIYNVCNFSSNSKSLLSQIKNSSSSRARHSSSSQNSSSISNRSMFNKQRLHSEKLTLSSSRSSLTTKFLHTDPIHSRKSLLQQQSMKYSSSQEPNFSTISFYNDHELQIIEQSICELKSEEISLLEVEDWVKFVCLILKLDKKVFNKIVKLINRVIEPSDPMEAIFYYAGACISLYAKMQCQHIFHDHQREFPEIPAHSEHKRLQIESLHPILEIKQLRRAQCEVSDMVNFRFELHDTLIEQSLQICEVWNKYLQANKNAIKKRPFQFFTIGTQNSHQRRNYLYLAYIGDVIQFVRDLMIKYDQSQEDGCIMEQSPKIAQIKEARQPAHLQLVLLSIFVVISNNFTEKYCGKSDALTDSMILVSKFAKKVYKLSQSRIEHIQGLMKKSKQLQIQNLMTRIQLQQLMRLQNKTKDMKSKEQISKYIQDRSLRFRNVGMVKTHQELQWFI